MGPITGAVPLSIWEKHCFNTNVTDAWLYDISIISWTSSFEYQIHSRTTDNITNIETPGIWEFFLE